HRRAAAGAAELSHRTVHCLAVDSTGRCARTAAGGGADDPAGVNPSTGHPREISSMLILTRRLNETLLIGDDVVVKVLGIKGNQVRIGITAPRQVAVHREEIYARMKAKPVLVAAKGCTASCPTTPAVSGSWPPCGRYRTARAR